MFLKYFFVLLASSAVTFAAKTDRTNRIFFDPHRQFNVYLQPLNRQIIRDPQGKIIRRPLSVHEKMTIAEYNVIQRHKQFNPERETTWMLVSREEEKARMAYSQGIKQLEAGNTRLAHEAFLQASHYLPYHFHSDVFLLLAKTETNALKQSQYLKHYLTQAASAHSRGMYHSRMDKLLDESQSPVLFNQQQWQWFSYNEKREDLLPLLLNGQPVSAHIKNLLETSPYKTPKRSGRHYNSQAFVSQKPEIQKRNLRFLYGFAYTETTGFFYQLGLLFFHWENLRPLYLINFSDIKLDTSLNWDYQLLRHHKNHYAIKLGTGSRFEYYRQTADDENPYHFKQNYEIEMTWNYLPRFFFDAGLSGSLYQFRGNDQILKEALLSEWHAGPGMHLSQRLKLVVDMTDDGFRVNLNALGIDFYYLPEEKRFNASLIFYE